MLCVNVRRFDRNFGPRKDQMTFNYVLICETLELKEGVVSFSHNCIVRGTVIGPTQIIFQFLL